MIRTEGMSTRTSLGGRSSVMDTPQTSSSIAALRLLTGSQSSIRSNSKDSLEFAILLIQTFGFRYREHIQRILRKELSSVYDSVHRSFYEIQQKAALGFTAYVKHQFPHTQAVIEEYASSSRPELQAFSKLKHRSYETLVFIQKMLTYRACEREHLDTIEAKRGRALGFVFDLLNTQKNERKRAHAESVSRTSQVLSELSPEDELALTSLYFNGGALVYNRDIVYFSELIGMWGSLSRRADERKNVLLACVASKTKWLPSMWLSIRIPAFLRFKRDGSFKEFLVFSSIVAVQKNLEVVFPDVLVSFLATLFQNEQFRSDICYFTGNPPVFFCMDLREMKRDSAPYLETIQLFIFLTQNQGIKRENRGALFLMLFHRSHWKVDETDGFQVRIWKERQAEENEAFAVAFQGVEELAQEIAARRIDFSHPTEADLEFLTDSYLVDTLFFLWKHPRRDEFIHRLRALATNPELELNFCKVHELCQANRDCSRPESTAFLEQGDCEMFQQFVEKGAVGGDAQIAASSLGA